MAKGAQTPYVNEPTKTTPLEALRLNWPEERISELAGSVFPNLLEFGAKGDGKVDDTAAINAAIASLPNLGAAGPQGGTIIVPPGFIFLHEGEINLKGRQGVSFVGGGGSSGGGAIGSGTAIAPSVFIYGGAGGRAWDFRQSVACGLVNLQCFAWGSGFTGPIWDCSGIEAKPCQFPYFYRSRAEATTVGGKPAEKILHCIGLSLDYANEAEVDKCIFSSCLEGVQGLSSAAHSSVAHVFRSCIFAGNQTKHITNPHETWTIDGCVGEGLFNDKGEPLKSAGFIGYTVAGAYTRGVRVTGCWTGSNEAAVRVGVNIEAKGENWEITGNSLNTAEVGVFFPEGPIGSVVKANRLWKLNAGLIITGKTVDSEIAFNKATECIALMTDTIKERKGSIVQAEAGAALLVS